MLRTMWLFSICVLPLLFVNGYIVEPGPLVIATKGEIWPKPKLQTADEHFSVVRPNNLRFDNINNTCDILDQAFERYLHIIVSSTNVQRQKLHNGDQASGTWRNDLLFEDLLDVVTVNLKAPCETLPALGMDEAYIFILNGSSAKLESNSVWGILRGLESFSQMLVLADDNISLRINSTTIVDEPRFSHRGLLLDTSRHYIGMPIIYQVLDGMTYNKLNVFHWHIVDDQSFPYQSMVYPNLSEKGAYHPTEMIYTQEDIQNVIEYARIRGIRVLPEFDSPGHTRSWGVAYPKLLTACGGRFEGSLGPINPIVESTYEFMENIFSEVAKVFPDKFIHIGGDEVEFECWQSNTDITDYMRENNIRSFERLEEIYIQRIVNMLSALNSSTIVWQEVFVNGVRLPSGTVVHIWTGNRKLMLAAVTLVGYPALLSTCWYLDHLDTGGDWHKFYECDPHDFPGTSYQKQRVMGGEACMWSEVVDNTNVLQRIFPRVSATAEKLWSQQNVNNIDAAAKRLEEHACRMKIRGIPAQPPNGPGYCLI